MAVSPTLLVYVAGLREKPAAIRPLLARLRAEPGRADDEVWIYPNPVRPWTRGSLAGHAQRFADRLQAYWDVAGRPQEIVLVGHSIGGVLIRYAYLLACGELGGREQDWAANVGRIVLLAAPNGGVEPSRLPVSARLATVLGAAVLGRYAALDVLSGSAFVTNLRLEWIRRFATAGADAPPVVQVHGTADPLVVAEDSRDVERAPRGAQLVLPGATHGDIVSIDGVVEDRPGQRYELLRQAIIGRVRPTEPEPMSQRDRETTAVVFLLHGIRAGIGDWIKELRPLLDAGDGTVQVVSSSYGRLSAFNFVMPFARRATLRWFQDRYSYHFARYPDVPFHFVGHSNGTYMLGQSLRAVRALRFDRVYLAGSVLPRDFDWLECETRAQIRSLVNVCATKDVPVAWLCSALRGIGSRDIGVGGFAGFDMAPSSATQLLNVRGGHGAGLAVDALPAVAKFVRDGEHPVDPTETPPGWFALVSRAVPAVAPVLAAGIVASLAAVIALSASWLAVGIVAGAVAMIYGTLKVV